MLYAGILIVLFILELLYFKVAEYFNIIDIPNQRSSHAYKTLRGGGIIFSLSVIIYNLVFGWFNPFFTTGLIFLTAISFADDVKHQSRRLRAFLQLLASILLFIETTLPPGFLFWFIALVILMGMINVYNFMDGINGMTAFYSFTVMAGLFFLNRQLHAFDEKLLICVALSNVVFTFFNARRTARCFAGDIGSISMAYILLFLTTSCIVLSGNPIFLLFFTVYIIDAVITILQRISKREIIFDAHRQHLFQCLANENRMPQLLISGIYAFIQMVITAGVLFVWEKNKGAQIIYTAVVVVIVLLLYLLIKFRLIKKSEFEEIVSGRIS